MKKLISIILLSFLITSMGGMTAFAKDVVSVTATKPTPGVVSPLWNDVAFASVSANKSGTNVVAYAEAGTYQSWISCSGTLYLERFVNGRWTPVAWTGISGTGYVSASVSAAGVANNSYRARLYIRGGSDTLSLYSRTFVY